MMKLMMTIDLNSDIEDCDDDNGENEDMKHHLSKNSARKSFVSSGTHIFCHFSALFVKNYLQSQRCQNEIRHTLSQNKIFLSMFSHQCVLNILFNLDEVKIQNFSDFSHQWSF